MARVINVWMPSVLASAALLLGLASPVQASAPAQPPPPVPNDVCGASHDTVYTPDGQPLEDVDWTDSFGNHYAAGRSNPTGGAGSITLTATVYTVDGNAQYTYPALTFGTEPDSSCVEAPDTVAAAVGACDPATGLTPVTFTYTNVADGTGWSHIDPVARLDNVNFLGGTVYFDVTGKVPVPDGSSVTVTSGDNPQISYLQVPALAPGTYRISLSTQEAAKHALPNTFLVPLCGKRWYPYGDPVVGRPKAKIGRCREHKVRVTLDTRRAVAVVNYRVVVAKGKRERGRVVPVIPGTVKHIRLRKLRSGNSIGVAPQLDSVPGPGGYWLDGRRLRC